MPKSLLVTLLIGLAALWPSCIPEVQTVPAYPVFLQLDLTYRDKALRTQLGYKTYVQPPDFVAGKEMAGYGGVLVIHTIASGIRAFDLACPKEGLANVRVEVEREGLYAICPTCGTKYEVGESGSGVAVNASRLRLRPHRVVAKSNSEWIVTTGND